MFSPGQLNTPDHTPIVFRKKPSDVAPSSKYKGAGISSSVKLEKLAEEGNYTIKKYEPALIQQVVALRSKLSLKQEDFAKKYGIAITELKAFERNSPPYNPSLVSKLKLVLSKNS